MVQMQSNYKPILPNNDCKFKKKIFYDKKRVYGKVFSFFFFFFFFWDLYKKAHTPYKWHKELFNYGKKIGIKIFSTPFDEKAVDFLEKLKCPFYKVASFEMTDIPLIKKLASTNKHIIISTGMASIDEITLSFNKAKEFGAKKITLFCIVLVIIHQKFLILI